MSRFLAMGALAALMVLGACSESATDTHPLKLVSKRQALFKQFTKTLEPMGLVARDRKDYVKGEFQASAQALQELASQPWAFFAADGNYPPTRAKAEVWEKPAEFKQAQQDFQGAVDELARVSGSADMSAIRAAVDLVQKSCKRCHDEFRNQR